MAAPMAFVYGGKALLDIYMGNARADLTLQQNKINKIVADINAESAELEAYKALQHGYSQTARYQAVIDKTVGSQRAIQAATSDFDTSSGTAADVVQETRLTGYLNTLDIMQQARSKAKQLKIQAANIRLQSDMGTIQAGIDATSQRMGGMLNAISSGISGFREAGEFNLNALKTGSPTGSGSSGGVSGVTGYMGLTSLPSMME